MTWAIGNKGSWVDVAWTADTMSTNVSWPTHTTGDIGLLFVHVANGAAVVDKPTGWTLIDNYTSFANRLYLYARIATSGSETAAAVEWTGSTGSAVQAQIVTWTGGNATLGSLLDASSPVNTNDTTIDGNVAYGSFTPTADNTLTLLFWGYDGGNPAWTGQTQQTNFINGDFISTDTGSNWSTGWQYWIQTAASAVSSGSIALTGTGETGVSRSIVLALTSSALVKYLKLLAHSSAASATGVNGVVFSSSAGIAGTEIGEFTNKSFEATLESGKAVLKVPVADFGGGSLTTSDTPVALVRNTTKTTGIISCTVIEE